MDSVRRILMLVILLLCHLDITKFNVLYNSSLRFHGRLYAALDVDLCRVRLDELLEVLVQNPLLYVRDLVPKPCFEALAKLDQVRSEKKNGLLSSLRDRLNIVANYLLNYSIMHYYSN